jgi:hypothetical protein
MCPALFEPRAAELKVCIRCEAFLVAISVRSDPLFGAQLSFRFPLYPSRRRRAPRGKSLETRHGDDLATVALSSVR